LHRELLIAASPGERRAALVEDGRPVALWALRAWGRSRVGEIHLARVVRVLRALPGAFVALDSGAEALLSEEDARDLAPPERAAEGIGAWLNEGVSILVQVHRDAAAGKSPGVRGRLALAGDHLELLPTTVGIRFAGGIGAEDRAAITAALPDTPGVRIRRPGAPTALVAEREALLRRWATLREAANRSTAPALLAGGSDPMAPLVDDLAARPPAAIRVTDARAAAELRPLLLARAPQLAASLARDDQVADIIDAAFAEAGARVVPLPSGGRLTIDMAAAASLIDVDLGTASGERSRAGPGILAANREAAVEAARQIRLRGLAGPIVIDFVSMRLARHRDQVLAALRESLADDPAEPQLLGWTRLGHVELTRRRGPPPLHEVLMEPAEHGGWRPRSATVALEALRAATREARGAASLTLRLHPAVAAALAGVARPALEEFRAREGFLPVVEADPALPREGFDIRRG
jgi:Rne/Rng family ribonuclease